MLKLARAGLAQTTVCGRSHASGCDINKEEVVKGYPSAVHKFRRGNVLLNIIT
jgi:hypothetical protein